MSNCIRCHKELTTGGRFCPYCGAVQVKKQTPRQRGNGTGTAYKQGQTWTARITVGWKLEDGKKKRISRVKRGFATKREALEAIATLRAKKEVHATLDHYWGLYSSDDMLRLSESKQTAYTIAWGKLGNLRYIDIAEITVEDLKKAVSEACPTYYTARDAKALLRRLYALADADGIGNPRLPSYINLPKLNEKEGQAFSEEELEKLWTYYDAGNLDAGYILLMIYTGMMPG